MKTIEYVVIDKEDMSVKLFTSRSMMSRHIGYTTMHMWRLFKVSDRVELKKRWVIYKEVPIMKLANRIPKRTKFGK